MTDYFKLLDEPRRPWLDPASLRQKFVTRSAAFHPDKIHSASAAEKDVAARKFAEFNAACNCLAEPKSRLLHLLELELGARPKDIQQIPAGLADLFAEVATECRNVDAVLSRKTEITSPLLQVQFFERAQAWVDRLTLLRKKLDDLRSRLEDELKSIDEQWMHCSAENRDQLLKKIEDLYRLFGYFNRWNNQITERIALLSF